MFNRIALLLVLLMLEAPASADACSVIQPTFMSSVDVTRTNASLPAVQVDSYDLDRGCGSGGGDCSDLSSLTITLSSSATQPLNAYGALIEVVSGDAPDPLGTQTDAVTIQDGAAGVIWFGGGDLSSALDFSIAVRLVDSTGRVGPRSQPARIQAGTCCGCSAAGRGHASRSIWVAVLLLVVWFVGSRRLGSAARR